MTNSENNKLQGSKNVQSGTSNFNKTYGVRDGVKKQGNDGMRENLSKTYDVRKNDKSPHKSTCRHKIDRSKVKIPYLIGQNFVGQNFRRTKYFVGQKFSTPSRNFDNFV